MSEHQQMQQSKKSNPTFQKQTAPIGKTNTINPVSIIQRARMSPNFLSHADVLQLQRTIGNRAVGRLLSGMRTHSITQQVPIQRQEIPEEEKPLQGAFERKNEEETCPTCMQRQEISEEEEPLQGKMVGTVQLQEIPEEEEPLQTKRENNTGLPDNLKAGVESLSGIDMSDVRVHYNSDKPAHVGALAYTQGANIHVAPGQERNLPHEAWHVVQQAQGRVKPTMHLKDVMVNDDEGLECEADTMGRNVAKTQIRTKFIFRESSKSPMDLIQKVDEIWECHGGAQTSETDFASDSNSDYYEDKDEEGDRDRSYERRQAETDKKRQEIIKIKRDEIEPRVIEIITKYKKIYRDVGKTRYLFSEFKEKFIKFQKHVEDLLRNIRENENHCLSGEIDRDVELYSSEIDSLERVIIDSEKDENNMKYKITITHKVLSRLYNAITQKSSNKKLSMYVTNLQKLAEEYNRGKSSDGGVYKGNKIGYMTYFGQRFNIHPTINFYISVVDQDPRGYSEIHLESEEYNTLLCSVILDDQDLWNVVDDPEKKAIFLGSLIAEYSRYKLSLVENLIVAGRYGGHEHVFDILPMTGGGTDPKSKEKLSYITDVDVTQRTADREYKLIFEPFFCHVAPLIQDINKTDKEIEDALFRFILGDIRRFINTPMLNPAE